MTVFSTSQLVDAIANQEPEVCLASGYYKLEALLDLSSSSQSGTALPPNRYAWRGRLSARPLRLARCSAAPRARRCAGGVRS